MLPLVDQGVAGEVWHNLISYAGLHEPAWNTGERDWAVVFWVRLWTLLINRVHIGTPPVISHPVITHPQVTCWTRYRIFPRLWEPIFTQAMSRTRTPKNFTKNTIFMPQFWPGDVKMASRRCQTQYYEEPRSWDPRVSACMAGQVLGMSHAPSKTCLSPCLVRGLNLAWDFRVSASPFWDKRSCCRITSYMTLF